MLFISHPVAERQDPGLFKHPQVENIKVVTVASSIQWTWLVSGISTPVTGTRGRGGALERQQLANMSSLGEQDARNRED